MWFYFAGNSARAYAEALFEQRSVIFPSDEVESGLFRRIFFSAQAIPFNEHRISADIHALLSHLAAPEHGEADYQPVAPTVDYIRSHFAQPITVDELAARCTMSTSHFIRSFQKHLNRTPHE